ncbi:MAG: hypothetical protein IT331_04655 [Anaerolineae bacterium]|nr:hypothetical protein [Anaerolineae bacterium]
MVFASTRDKRARVFYRMFVGRQQLQGKHLVVVVKYIQEDERRGYVNTIYLSHAVYSRGDVLWKNLEKNFPFE